MSPDGIADLLREVHSALAGLGTASPAPTKEPEPRIPIRQSITRDHLVSFEDGRKYRFLRNHLAARGLTPAQYRAKWELPADYPMVAPSYFEMRLNLAKQAGFGRKKGAVVAKRSSRSRK